MSDRFAKLDRVALYRRKGEIRYPRRRVLLIAAIFVSSLALSCASRLTCPVQQSTIAEVVDNYARGFVRKDGPGLAVAVVRGDSVALERYFGIADLETKLAVGPNTRFYLASVTKQITAMAVMLLHEDGLIEFDDRISGYFPEAPETWSGITVHHLLTHQSGIAEYLELPKVAGWSNQDVLDLVVERAPQFTPGQEYRYSNSGYVLLALLVERVSKIPFQEFVHERIFVPLGMRQSVVFDESGPVVPSRAVGYWPDGRLHDYPLRSMGDGGIYSSLNDLQTWVVAVSDSGPVSSETLRLAFKPHRGRGYGYGWFVDKFKGRKRLYHAGALVGYATHVSMIPEEGLAVIVLSNGTFRDEVPDLVERILCFYL